MGDAITVLPRKFVRNRFKLKEQSFVSTTQHILHPIPALKTQPNHANMDKVQAVADMIKAKISAQIPKKGPS